MSGHSGAGTWEMLRQQARATGYDVQALATNYVIERFIARLMAGNDDGTISIKGGQSLGILFGNQMRPTKDLDLNVEIIASGEDRNALIMAAVREACTLEVEDGVTFDTDKIGIDIRKHQGEGGLRLSMAASIHTSRVPFLIDVGIGNEMTFDPIRMEVQSILNGRKTAPPPTQVVVYPMENTIAEKLVSKFEDGMASIRHKDFFDLWLLIETLRRAGDFAVLDGKNKDANSESEAFRNEIRHRLADGTLLQMSPRPISEECMARLSLALARTAESRGTNIPEDVTQFLMSEFAEDSVQSKQWANWFKNNASKLKYHPPGLTEGDRTKALAALVCEIGPFLEEVATASRSLVSAASLSA